MTEATSAPAGGLITAEELYRKAILFKELTLPEGELEERHGRISLLIKRYRLNELMLGRLARAGITREWREPYEELFTLVDRNPQAKPAPGWGVSNYWNFRYRVVEETIESSEIQLDKNSLDVTLWLKFVLNEEKGGISISPVTMGTILGPSDLLPNLRMLRVLAEIDDDKAPKVVHELAASEGTLLVSWADLGLEGLESMGKVFQDFAKGNNAIYSLHNRSTIFSPRPQAEFGKNLPYVMKDAQEGIIQKWREQLEAYRESLRVV